MRLLLVGGGHSHLEVLKSFGDATLAGKAQPKSGVIAVRQGPALARNLRLALAGRSLQPFRAPQERSR
jgi:selenide,water dikinase